ncbi:hypothetical protein [Nitratireductor alexandrii]|uniref:hypothetical protein n=1 Tax=Nitratireductor alexandrii TaxID=2448161 RepID=UPI000FDA3B62|nr:hypothetical protein [Nitratireductor alexandrii]
MAKSATERSREFRKRQKDAERKALTNPATPASYVKTPFSAFIADRWPDFDENLDAFGVQITGSPLSEELQSFPTQYDREEPLTSLQRAMGLVDVFIDAAQELAHLINVYKLQEIERAIEDAMQESADLPKGDVEALKVSFAEIYRLKAIRSELRRPSRHIVLGTRAEEEEAR